MSPLKDLFHALQSHDSARATLPRVKTTLLKHDLLVPNASSSVSDVVLARDILELAALVSVRAHDGTAFERYLAQLGSFWELDLKPASSHRAALVGLQLLHLLSRNEVGRFHTVLETLAASGSALLQDRLVQYPIELERHLMEGSYSKVWAARCDPPLPECAVFLDDLMATIRREIAACAERAYPSLPVEDAATLLFFDKKQDLLAFAAEINPTSHIITFGASTGKAVDTPLQRERIIEAALSYASALETIV